MNVPFVEFLGLHITEPFTWLTNWLMAIFALSYAHFLFHDKRADTTQKFWSIFFVFIGFASFTGGIAHGFKIYVGQNFHYAAWILTGIAIFAAELATIQLIENEKIKSIVRLFIYAQLIIMVGSVMYQHNFNAVRFNSALGLLGIVLPISFLHYQLHNDKRSALIMVGIISILIPSTIHALKISYNHWFNFNDISHIAFIFCFFIIYRGARQNSNLNLEVELS